MRRSPLLPLLLLATLLQPGPAQPNTPQDRVDARFFRILPHPEDPDQFLCLLWGGFTARAEGMTIRGENAIIGVDRDEWAAAMQALVTAPPLPPRSGPVAPRPSPNPAALEASGRLFASLIAEAARSDPERLEMLQRLLASPQVRAARWIYIEGGAALEERGHRSIQAERLHFDLQDGSFAAEEALLRLPFRSPSGEWASMVVRAPLITQNYGRIQARKARFTYCDYEEPHYYLAVDLLESWQDGDGWVFQASSSSLWIHSVPVFWLPSLSWRAGEKGPLPLKGASVGSSSKWGYFLFTEWGKSLRRQGEAINDALGLPGRRFRGEWTLTTGFSTERGFPVQLDLKYGIPSLYEGRATGFILDDQGERRRGSVRTKYDGEELPDLRWLGTTENRIFVGPGMRVDAQVDRLGDPGVLPEFFKSRFRRDELPETSLHWSWASENRALSLLGRWQINDSAYGEDRALAESFVEQAPSASFTWIGEPLLELPWGQQALLSIEGETTRFERDFTDTLNRKSEETLRSYGDLDLAAPFSIGPVRFRPYAALAAARYDRATRGEEGSRALAAGGLRSTLHLSRYYPVRSSILGLNGLLHQLDPEVGYMHRSIVSGDDASTYPQFDRRDALGERQEIVLALRNRLLTARKIEGEFRPTTVMRADVALTLYPDADRDNQGNTLGLVAFEAAWQPLDIVQTASSSPSFSAEGQYDPNQGDLKTLHLRAGVPIGEFQAAFGWIRSTGYKGTVYGGTNVTMLGRWQAALSASYDLERSKSSGLHAALHRLDHDWTLGLVLRYDEGEDDFQVSIQFLPGGWIGQTRRPPVGGMDPLDTLL